MREKKNLRRVTLLVTAQTAYNLTDWPPCAGIGSRATLWINWSARKCWN